MKKIIGSNIRKLRKSNNLNQVEFSRRIGISQGNLSEIEQGNCNLSLDTLLAIKEEFKCSLDKLLTHLETNLEKGEYFPCLSEDEVTVLNQYRLLDKFDKEEIIEMIKVKISINRKRDKL